MKIYLTIIIIIIIIINIIIFIEHFVDREKNYEDYRINSLFCFLSFHPMIPILILSSM